MNEADATASPSVAPVPPLRGGQQYDSWLEFFASLKMFMDINSHPLVRSSNRTAAAANSRMKKGPYFPDTPELKYAYCRFECSHRGTYKPKKPLPPEIAKCPKKNLK